jgi:hypothetical protein
VNVHGVSDAWQMEIHAIEPLVAEPSSFKLEIATE